MDWNTRIYNALDLLFSTIENLGLGLSILAWISVFFSAIALGIILSKFPMRKVWFPSLAVGLIALEAHIFDYFITLRVSPNLAEEANPIWRIVIDNLGINIAKFYGLTGKILLAVLSFELFAYYLIKRERLFPKRADSFFSFWHQFGRSKRIRKVVCWCNLVNFFSFAFALTGPFFFYVAYLNSVVADSLYYRLPPMPLMLFLYAVALLIAYLLITHRAFQSTKVSFTASRREPQSLSR